MESGKCHTGRMLSIDSTSEIKENYEFDEILSTTNLDELDIRYSSMNELHDVLEGMLGVALAPCETGLVRLFHSLAFVWDPAFIALQALFTPGI